MTGRPSPQNVANPLLASHARLREAERLRQAKAFDKPQSICADLLRAHPDYVAAVMHHAARHGLMRQAGSVQKKRQIS